MKQIKLLCAALAISASLATHAEEATQAKPGWSGQGEAGINFSTGNTDSENANIGLKFKYIGKSWENDFSLGYFLSSSDGVDSAQSLSADYLAKRNLSERRFLFGFLSYLDDDFDGFTEQASVGVGYGYRLSLAEPLTWSVGAGLGYRDTSELFIQDDGTEIEGDDLGSATIILFSDSTLKLSSNTDLVNKFIAEIGSENTFIESDSALVVGINNAFALKLGILFRHNTDPAEGSDDTDTITSANLVYNFK